MESKQRPEAVVNDNKTTNGVLTPSTMSSSDDRSNAWSTPGSAAVDFRSAFLLPPYRNPPFYPTAILLPFPESHSNPRH